MVKYCGHCGAEMEKNAKFCGICGNTIADPGINEKSDCVGRTEMKPKNKKFAKIAIIVVIIALVTGVTIKFIPQGSSPEKLVEKVAIACEKKSSDGLVSYLSGNSFADDAWGLKNFDEYISEINDSFEYDLGTNFEMSYIINDISAPPSHWASMINEELYYYSSDTPSLDEFAVADVTFEAQSGEETSVYDIYIYMGKEDGKWKLLFMEW